MATTVPPSVDGSFTLIRQKQHTHKKIESVKYEKKTKRLVMSDRHNYYSWSDVR